MLVAAIQTMSAVARTTPPAQTRPASDALRFSAEISGTAADAVLARRSDGGIFTNIGQLFGGVSGISGSDPAADDVEEDAVAKLAELVTVRPNYFTVLACSQTVRDVAGIKYDSDGDGVLDTTAAYNQFDVKYDAAGNVVEYVDPVLAEQKILATLYRDALTNAVRVERFEYIEE